VGQRISEATNRPSMNTKLDDERYQFALVMAWKNSGSQRQRREM
jgi:hypothetical protein